MANRIITAISLLIGTTIGAGFLGMPYVFAKAGFLIGAVHLLIITTIILLINLYIGEISLRTKGNHQLTGYAYRYLGKRGRKLMLFLMIFSIYSALLAYIIGEGNSLSFLIFGATSSYFISGIVFWLMLSILNYSGIRALKKYEPLSVALIIILVFIIIALFLPRIELQNLSSLNTHYLFLPFGVVLFAMLGYTVMPEMKIVLKGKEKYMKKAIIIGTLIPAFIYLLFAISVSGTFGKATPEIATLALGKIFVILGMATMFTAYLVLSISLEDVYMLDYNISKKKSWFLTTIIPISLFMLLEFLNQNSFVKILSISGTISGGIAGILILFMNLQAKRKGNRKPEYSIPINKTIVFILSLIFILGILLEIFLH